MLAWYSSIGLTCCIKKIVASVTNLIMIKLNTPNHFFSNKTPNLF